MSVWQELGDGIYRRRYESLDLNVGLVVADDHVLVIDSRATHEQADELIREITGVTTRPVSLLVNTHHHWDHTFGNARFPGVDIVGHERCRERLIEHGEDMRSAVLGLEGLGPRERAMFEAVEITPPATTFDDALSITIGDRSVALRFVGRGHTDNDIIVSVDDVLFAGDLVEEGAPPAFGDAYPREWVDTLGSVVELVRGPVVPGHGDVVDRAYVEQQREHIARAVAGEAVFPDATMREIEGRIKHVD